MQTRKSRKTTQILKDYVEAILANLKGTNKTLDLPTDLQGDRFSNARLGHFTKNSLRRNCFVSRCCRKLGNKNAVRAVATACASNRVALVIPCHRVVRSSGELSGYRWGIERKKQLLDNEKQ